MPPLKQSDAHKLVKRRHPEWREHQERWRFLQDSLEGGERYKHADYSIDPTQKGTKTYSRIFDQVPADYSISRYYPQRIRRNLIPHLRETDERGQDLYWMRLERTPVPQLVERSIESHLGGIYREDVVRKGPGRVVEWWDDVDGRMTPIGRWMQETVAPLFLTVGFVDVLFDHPAAPDEADIVTAADAAYFGVTSCVASIVLPENVVWWSLDPSGAYKEVVIFERKEDGDVCYHHWTKTECNVYRDDGKAVDELCREHPFGRVPVARVFDRRLVRCQHVGRSRYGSVADLQKAVFNGRSELILSDINQSHAQLMGPSTCLSADAEIKVGPDAVLPKVPIMNQSGLISGYEGWEYLDPPKGAQSEARLHVQDWLDEIDRDTAMSKPAGLSGGSTVAQSGISKIVDQTALNTLLAKIASSLEAAERVFAEFALAVIGDGEPGDSEVGSIDVEYPREFDLYTLEDLTLVLDTLQRSASSAGSLPETEGELLKRLVVRALPGLRPDRLAVLEREIDQYLGRASAGNPGEEDERGTEQRSDRAAEPAPDSDDSDDFAVAGRAEQPNSAANLESVY